MQTVVVRGWDRRVRLPLVIALVAAALLLGALVGYRSDQPDGAAAGEVLVDETTVVVRQIELTPHEEFSLDVPARLAESWGETLVSSNPEVVEVLRGGVVRTGEPGTATLSVQDDTGQNERMFEVTVTN